MAAVQDEIPGLVIHTVRQPEDQPASIQAQFETFHQLNPWVLRALEALTADYLKRGARRVGIGMLFEVLRWRYVTATEGEDEFRLNNNFRSRYVRLLIERHPEWAPAFEVRSLRTD
ncbi:hypothetical protein AB0M05_35960 [Streptomyces violaceusniger]|uniref:hypothetical protein n=1 Tax=Streptomyces TaxID=1883 RepID=UPI000B8D7161|nr:MULTISPECIES: hypothetical protein [unclassified Streptomyces]ASQ94439.1 hypothetical protein CGL27_16380 [Streptomyces sp. 11-1-2]RSS49072.1 hypothetical protein EF902_02805 [Streptomyces sp. WAC05858]